MRLAKLSFAAAWAAVGFLWVQSTPVPAQEPLPELPPELTELRESLDKYQEPYAAVRNLYFSTVGCVEYPEGGGEGEVSYDEGTMGVHLVNTQLLLDGKLNPEKPEVLVYNRQEDGSLQLVAAEWMVPADAVEERPSLYGREFQGPMSGHVPLMPKGFHHYDLHVWLWRENPAGLFAPTNPAIECAGTYTVEEDAPDLVVTGESGS